MDRTVCAYFRSFLSAIMQRLKDQHLQSWYAEPADSSKLCLYKDYKLYYEHETYLNCLISENLDIHILCRNSDQDVII